MRDTTFSQAVLGAADAAQIGWAAFNALEVVHLLAPRPRVRRRPPAKRRCLRCRHGSRPMATVAESPVSGECHTHTLMAGYVCAAQLYRRLARLRAWHRKVETVEAFAPSVWGPGPGSVGAAMARCPRGRSFARNSGHLMNSLQGCRTSWIKSWVPFTCVGEQFLSPSLLSRSVPRVGTATVVPILKWTTLARFLWLGSSNARRNEHTAKRE